MPNDENEISKLRNELKKAAKIRNELKEVAKLRSEIKKYANMEIRSVKTELGLRKKAIKNSAKRSAELTSVVVESEQLQKSLKAERKKLHLLKKISSGGDVSNTEERALMNIARRNLRASRKNLLSEERMREGDIKAAKAVSAAAAKQVVTPVSDAGTEIMSVKSEMRDIFSDISSKLSRTLDIVREQYGSTENAYKEMAQVNASLVKRIEELQTSANDLSVGAKAISESSAEAFIEDLGQTKAQTKTFDESANKNKKLAKQVDNLSESASNHLEDLEEKTGKLHKLGDKVSESNLAEEMMTGLGRSVFGDLFDIPAQTIKALTGSGTLLKGFSKGAKSFLKLPKFLFLFGAKTYSKVKAIPDKLSGLTEETKKGLGKTYKGIKALPSSKSFQLLTKKSQEVSDDKLGDVVSESSSMVHGIEGVRKGIAFLGRKLSSSMREVERVTERGFGNVVEGVEDVTDDLKKIKKQQKKQLQGIRGIEGGGGIGGLFETWFVGSKAKGLLGKAKGLLGKGKGLLGKGLLGAGARGAGAAVSGVGAAGASLASIASAIAPALGVALSGAVGVAIGTAIDKISKKFLGKEGIGGWLYEKIHGKEEAKPKGNISAMTNTWKKKLSAEAWEEYGSAIKKQTINPVDLLGNGAIVKGEGNKLWLPDELQNETKIKPVVAEEKIIERINLPISESVPSVAAPPVPPTTQPTQPPVERVVQQQVSGRESVERSIRSFPVLVDDLGMVIANSGLL